MQRGRIQHADLEVLKAVEKLRPVVEQVIEQGGYPFPPALILAVIQAETGGTPGQVNTRSGATGLMQIMPITLKDYNKRNKTSYVMDDLRKDTDNSILLQVRVGTYVLGVYWKGAYQYLNKRLGSVELPDLAQIGSLFYVAGPGRAKPRLDRLSRPTFEAVKQRYGNWNATKYAARVWRFTGEQSPVWDLDAVDKWVKGAVGNTKPPLIARTEKNGFLLAMLIMAVGSYFISKKAK